jgi:hypothetical protein
MIVSRCICNLIYRDLSKFERINFYVMSIAKIKLAAISKITGMDDETTLKEVR